MEIMKLIELRTGLKLKKSTQFEVGKRYYIGYWGKTLTVLKSKPSEIYGTVYICLWEDGKLTSNSTAFDKRNDFEIIGKHDFEFLNKG